MEWNAEKTAQRAVELHEGGWHCAEAVLLSVLEPTEHGRNPLVPRMAGCFQAGVGRSRKEICGALAGGLMALGCLAGRDRSGEPLDAAGGMAVDVRDRFQALYGSTRCSEILEAMGPQQNGDLCHRLSGRTAQLVCDVLNEGLE